MSRWFKNTRPRPVHWGCVLLLLLNTVLMAAGPDPEGLVLYLPCEHAQNPIDGSADPTTPIVEGSLSLADGQFGTKGLEFDGNNANRIAVTHAAKLEGMSALTIEAWALPQNIASHEGMSIVSKRNANQDGDAYNLFIWTGQIVEARVNATGGINSTTALQDNTWYHIAYVFDAQANAGEKTKIYINGVLENSGDHTDSVAQGSNGGGAPLWIGELDAARNFPWDGVLDEIGIWNIALTAEDINLLMVQSKMKLLRGDLASTPTPADGADDMLSTTDLAWAPGDYAATHNVYLGLSREDVNTAAPATLIAKDLALDTASIDVGRLEFGQTYYWRVDEVNGAPDFAVIEGDIWSFTVEPVAYPIAGVLATCNVTSGEGAGPERTVDGSGLGADGTHSTDSGDMWLVTPTGVEPLRLAFAFDRVYKLHEMLVWNYNVMFELILGFGCKNVTVEYSVDGAEWMLLGDVTFAQANAKADYTANSAVDFGGVAAQYVRLTVNGGYGTIDQFGLSEVQFMYIPAHARQPQPTDGTADVSVNTVLAWRAGREAVTHEVSLGTDPEALAFAGAVDTAGYDPGVLNLDTGYYWKVDEVNETDARPTWEGTVWTFTTQEYFVVEDFESYNDEDNLIYESWLDGWVNETSSTVGYLEAPFAEQTIVRSGRQSMPLFYENTSVVTAEADFELAQDWTASGVNSLAIAFAGATGNTGQLYVKINNTKIPYDGEPSALAIGIWQAWNIDLSTAGNVSSVRSLTIGIEGDGASGVVYIDDIRLYAQPPQFIMPVEPDDANLVAHYTFDGNANDRSGHGFNGTVNGAPTYGAGADGQAIALDGVQDYVSVESVGISDADARTISGWAKADTTAITAWTDVFGFTGSASNGEHFDIEAIGDSGTTATLGYYGLHRHGWEQDILPIDLEWHHLAATFDGTTVHWYGDGRPIGSADVDNVNTPGPFHVGKRQDNQNFFPGAVDEVRVYDRALSDEEIAWLAGLTEPIHKPF